MLIIYYTSIYFKVIAEGLGWMIQRYNKTIEPERTIEWELTGTIKRNQEKSKFIKWIIIGLQDLHFDLSGKYIVWNFEQYGVDNSNLKDIFWTRLSQAEMIWDYSKENIKWLKDNKNLNAQHLPLGWMPQMKINIPIKSWIDRNNTFAFVGVMNTRRRDILKPIHELAKENNLTMYLSNSCWNSEYETIYSMTKFGLNIHFYTGNTILEVHRIIPLILNEVWVISEKSNDIWYDELFDSLVTWAEPNTFAQVINELNNLDPETINLELSERKRKLMQTCDMYKFFIDSNLIESII